MPYTIDNPPDYVKNLPKRAIELCVAAWNATYERTQDEDKSRIACWGAVKTKFEQNPEGEWIQKTKEASMLNLEELNSVQKAYAAHNRLHAEYLDARHAARKKAQIQEDHEIIVRHILKLGGRHIPKGDALDDTLPQELKEAVKLRYVCDGFVCSDAEPAISEIQILRTGTFHHLQYGKFIITDDTLETMVKNFSEVRPKAPTELVVDFEHLSSGEISETEQGKAAGWIKGLVKKDSRLFAMTEWTEEAADLIRKKEFRFISPEFDLDYMDKETGKNVGPTLISVALTNRPFLEGMQPVVLSENLGAMIFTETGEQEINNAKEKLNEDLIGTSEDSEMCLAEWDTKYINDLPDKCFAYIKPGGEKDEEGKTAPRALRYLPYRDKDGKVDLPHLRNALSRLPQTKLAPEEKAKARKVLIDAAREAGVGEYSELPGVTESEWKEEIMETKLREILGLSEDADVVEAVRAIKTKSEEATTLQAQLTDLEGKFKATELKLTETEADKVVEDALQQGKLVPKMKEWAKAYVLRDPDGFKAFVQMTEKVGPDLTIKGQETGAETIQLTETETKVSKVLGVSEEAIVALKKADQEAK